MIARSIILELVAIEAVRKKIIPISSGHYPRGINEPQGLNVFKIPFYV